jgi:membrane associated rhomboid family serine protease
MIPIGDENPTLRRPVMTYLILAAIFAAWVLAQGAGMDQRVLATSACNLGLIPAELTHRVALGILVPLGNGLTCLVNNEPINTLTPLTSMFVHGSWGHILGNSLYLWIFGNNVEDSTGRARFLAFYLICGLAAAAAHVALEPTSLVPTVGASGAISGIMGAYLVLYPHARIRMFFPPFFLFHVPAWLMLVFWFGTQVLTGLPQLSPMRREVSGGVAVWAHVGGFIAGVILIKLFENRSLVRRRLVAGDARAAFDPNV